MPEFAHPFNVLKHNTTISSKDLIRIIRFMIAAEYEAVSLYTQVAESTDNELAKAVLLEIADEEKVHAGEFLRLLAELAPDELKFYKEGYGETEKIIKKTGIKSIK